MSKVNFNSDILQIAATIVEANDDEVVQLLLELQNLLNELPSTDRAAQKARRDVYELGLLDVCFSVLNSDFILDNWIAYGNVAELVSDVCTALRSGKDENDKAAYEQILLVASDMLLQASVKLHTFYPKFKASSKEDRINIMSSLRTVLDALILLISAHSWLATFVLQANSYMALLMSDEIDTTSLIMSLISNFVAIRPGLFKELDSSDVYNIMDELVYKLTGTKELIISSIVTRILLTIIDDNNALTKVIFTRYKGLRQLLNRWVGKGFDTDLKQLIYILESGSAKSAHEYRINHAASVIQSAFRGYMERKKLYNVNRAITRFQRILRQRLQEKKARKAKEKEKQLRMQRLEVKRRRGMIQSKERQLEALTAIPSTKMEAYYSKSEYLAAAKIQAVWRGILARRKVNSQLNTLRQYHAACTIQRYARRFLEKIRNKRYEETAKAALMPPGLDDQRRVELMEIVDRWKNEGKSVNKDEEEVRQKYQDMQEMLERYYSILQLNRRKEQEIQALLATMTTDLQLLEEAPSLAEVQPDDLETFSCYSRPIAIKAKELHQAKMKSLTDPWWMHLNDNSDDDDDDDFFANFR